MGKIILNTDIGEDIDDLIALEILLKSHESLIGVITSGDDPRLKAKFAKKVIRQLGKDVPVFYEERPPKNKNRTSSPYINERDYSFLTLKDLKADDLEFGIKDHGIRFLVDSINDHPGEVTVISIAPNTNLKEAMEIDHELDLKVKAFYVMGGCISDSDPKVWKSPCFNLRSDIPAYEKVLNSRAVKYIIGKDSKLYLNGSDLLKAGSNDVVLSLFEKYMAFFNKNKYTDAKIMPDPLTVCACLFPDLYEFKRIRPQITKKGQMFGIFAEEGNTYGCVNFNSDGVKDKIIGIGYLKK